MEEEIVIIQENNEEEIAIIQENNEKEIELEKEPVVYKVNSINDYEELDNKPKINGIELIGDKTTEDLGIIDDVNAYIEEHKEELRGQDGKDGYTPIKGVDYFDGSNGVDGYTPVKGIDYFDGKNGANGKDGVSCTHSWNGTTLTITSASGTTSANLKGEPGQQGEKGQPFVYSDFTEEQLESLIGSQGPQGIQGPQGEKGDTGATGPEGPQGPQGATGPAGKDGTNGINGTNGKDGEDGYTPIKGTDYYTEADKQEMVQLVLNALPSSEEVGY